MALDEKRPLLGKEHKINMRLGFTRVSPSPNRHLQGNITITEETTLLGSYKEQKTVSTEDNTANKTAVKEPVKKKPPLRLLMLIPIVVLMDLASNFNSYAITEYTQQAIQKIEFPDRPNNLSFAACHDVNKTSPDYKKHQTVQQITAKWKIYFSLTANIPCLISVLILGSYSDKFGRKLLLIVSIVGMSMKFVLSFLVVYCELDLSYFLIGLFVEGMTGTSRTYYLAIFAVIADVTAAGQTRTFYIVVFDTILIAASTIATLSTGYFINNTGFAIPMLTASGVAVFCLLLAVVFIPETSIHTDKDTVSVRKILCSPFTFFSSGTNDGLRVKYLLLFVCYIFLLIASSGRGAVEVIYQLAQPFCWNPATVGIYGSVKDAVKGIIGMGTIRLFQKCLTDEVIALVGIVSSAAAGTMEGLATTDMMMFMVPVLSVFSGTTGAIIRGILSKMTPNDRQVLIYSVSPSLAAVNVFAGFVHARFMLTSCRCQSGALFASMGALQELCSMSASAASNGIYSATLSIYNGFVFLVFAGCYIFSFLFLFIFIHFIRKRDKIASK